MRSIFAKVLTHECFSCLVCNCGCFVFSLGNAIYEKVTNAFVLERASTSSMPFAIDDPTKVPNKGCDLSDVIFELHNGGKYANVRSGAQYAKSLPIVAINYNLRDEER